MRFRLFPNPPKRVHEKESEAKLALFEDPTIVPDHHTEGRQGVLQSRKDSYYPILGLGGWWAGIV